MKTDFAAIDVEWKLHYEDAGPLADWIENDNELTPLMRDYLVKLLRGHLPQKKRNKKNMAASQQRNRYIVRFIIY